MTNLSRLASYEDFRGFARKTLPRLLFDYIDGGAYDEATLRRNPAAFKEASLTQRVMIDVSDVSSKVTLFGETIAMPVVLGPVGFAGMYARRGEAQAAQAAKEAGIPFCLSTVGICSVEEVTQAATAPWYQLYMIKDRPAVDRMLARAWATGARVLVLTGDLQTPGARYRDIRSGMMRSPSLSDHLKRAVEGVRRPNWTWDVFLRGRPHSFGNLKGELPDAASFNQAWEWIGSNFDPSVSWKDIAHIRDQWRGPIVLKGVMAEEDAHLALDHGLDGVIVSNHGGRQLDGTLASLEALPAIADCIDGKIPVLMDGGLRSGLDVLKAINLGATACLFGKAWAFALAAGGKAGVARWLSIIAEELRTGQVLSATHRLQSGQ